MGTFWKGDEGEFEQVLKYGFVERVHELHEPRKLPRQVVQRIERSLLKSMNVEERVEPGTSRTAAKATIMVNKVSKGNQRFK
jgi:hypothetical protein